MKCSYCLKEFPDEELDLSHDIPQYMGGTDADGRHYLCNGCHKKYELLIINKCFYFLGFQEVYEEKISSACYYLKSFGEPLHSIFRVFAEEVKEEFYGT